MTVNESRLLNDGTDTITKDGDNPSLQHLQSQSLVIVWIGRTNSFNGGSDLPSVQQRQSGLNTSAWMTSLTRSQKTASFRIYSTCNHISEPLSGNRIGTTTPHSEFPSLPTCQGLCLNNRTDIAKKAAIIRSSTRSYDRRLLSGGSGCDYRPRLQLPES